MKTRKNITTKKLFIIAVGFMLLVATVFGVLFGTHNANAETSYNLDYVLNCLSTENVKVNNSSFEIYGNSTVSDKEFRDLVNTGSPKIYLHYRTEREIDLPYDALLSIKTHSKIYSYEFIEKESTDANSILNGIVSFITKYSKILSGNNYYALERNAPMTLANDTSSTFESVVSKVFVMRFGDRGYITYRITVSRYVVNSVSILYIVSVQNSFTPGIVAVENGESDYSKYKNYKGYAHMTVEQAYDANEEYYYGKRWGNVPYQKDYWPLNTPSTVSITSSITPNLNLGFSTENGFSIGAGVSFGYSKTVTQSEPRFSAQLNSSNPAKCEWNYEYNTDAPETYHLNTNYMFEMSNSRRDMFIGDFRLKLDYSFSVDKGWWESSKTSTGSVDLIVRAGEYRDIYNFCSGMI